MKKIFNCIYFVIFFCASLTVTNNAMANIKPTRLDMSLSQGQNKVIEYIITNDESQNVEYEPGIIIQYLNDENSVDNSGEFEAWFNFDQDIYSIEPESDLKINTTINVPIGAELGTKYFSVVFERVVDENTPKMRLASLLAITIEKGGNFEVDTLNIKVDQYRPNRSVKFELQVKNDNDEYIYVVPKGEIVIKDEKGKQIKGISRYINNHDVEVLSDVLLINTQKGKLNASDSVIYNFNWNENVSKGKFSAEVFLEIGKEKYEQAIYFSLEESVSTDEVLSYTFFDDIFTDNYYYDAIRYVKANNIVNGFSDRTYKSGDTINRAEFTKIIVNAIYSEEKAEDCFPKAIYPDTSASEWFSKYTCLASHEGIIDGYPDGTFKPTNSIKFVEASKIIVKAFNLETESNDGSWYVPFVKTLQNKNAIPVTIQDLNHLITRGEMAEMIYRLKAGIINKRSKKLID